MPERIIETEREPRDTVVVHEHDHAAADSGSNTGLIIAAIIILVIVLLLIFGRGWFGSSSSGPSLPAVSNSAGQ